MFNLEIWIRARDVLLTEPSVTFPLCGCGCWHSDSVFTPSEFIKKSRRQAC